MHPFLYLYNFTVPRSPPTDVTGTNSSSTSLRVNWGEVPFPDRLGIILGYRVLLWRTNQSVDVLENVTVPAPSRNISFSRLEKYTNYTIQVLAFTAKGDGKISESIVVITDEDGKSRIIIYSCSLQHSHSSCLSCTPPLRT